VTTTQNTQLLETSQKAEPLLSASTAEHGPGLGFFAVGMVINVVLIIAYFVWAYKQGRKKGD